MISTSIFIVDIPQEEQRGSVCACVLLHGVPGQVEAGPGAPQHPEEPEAAADRPFEQVRIYVTSKILRGNIMDNLVTVNHG